MEPLILLPEDKWPALRDSFRSYWPFGVAGFNLLDTQIRFKEMGLGDSFIVYCPYGNIANGMVAEMKKSKVRDLIILANSNDTNKLEEALLTTKLVDWTLDRIELPYILPNVKILLERIYPKLGLKIVEEGPSYMHVYNRNWNHFENVVCPEGASLAPLNRGHVNQIDNVWPHRYPSSDWFFTLLIDSKQSWGLFDDESNLMAWMLINDGGFLCHLYCEEPYRKRGYAEFLVKYVTNDQIRKGKDVHCYIVETNEKSMALFKKLGYENVGKSIWTFLKKV